MKIIEGFSPAKSVLSRQVAADFYLASPALKQRLREMFGTEDPEQAVRQVINEVRNRGDKALLDLTLKIDGIELTSLGVSKGQITNAYREVDSELVSALKLAAERIRSFHVRQRDSLGKGFFKQGVGQLIRPLECVGIYAPGGTASYPSTVLMTAIPAKVAGVKEIILASSTRAGGLVPPPT